MHQWWGKVQDQQGAFISEHGPEQAVLLQLNLENDLFCGTSSYKLRNRFVAWLQERLGWETVVLYHVCTQLRDVRVKSR